MKVRIIKHDATMKNPEFDPLQRQRLGRRYRVPAIIPCPYGTIIDCHNAWKLVECGMALPEDDEAREACDFNQARFDKASKAYDKLMSGRATGDPRYDAPLPESEVEAESDEIEMIDDSAQTVHVPDIGLPEVEAEENPED